MVVGQTRLRTGARVTAGGTGQTLEDIRVVVAYIVLLLLPGDLHDGAVEAIRVAQGVESPATEALVRAPGPAAAPAHCGQQLASTDCCTFRSRLAVIALEKVKE